MDLVTVRFGRRVRELRLSSGLTQEQLAKAAGLDAKHIGVIERGKKASSFGAVARLAKALHVDIHELFVPDGQSGTATPKRGSSSQSPSLRNVPKRELERLVEDLAARIQRLPRE